jgi:hypothetical protein
MTRLGSTRMPKKRVVIATVVLVVVVALAAPLWSGYFGPKAVAYMQAWRPWRSHVSVQVNSKLDPKRPHDVHLVVTYNDPRPGPAQAAGRQTRFVTVVRPFFLLPWTVTEAGTGP